MRRIPLSVALTVCSCILGAAPQIGRMTDEQPPTFREQLARYGIGSDKSSLLNALANPDPEVRSLAALRLGEFDVTYLRADSIPALAEALLKEANPDTASAMAVTLGSLGDSRGLHALEKMCHDSAIGSQLKLQVARFLLNLNSGICFEEVVKLASSRNEGIASNALSLLPAFQRLQQLSSADQGRIVDVIRRGLSHSSRDLRMSAAQDRALMTDGAVAADLESAISMEQDPGVKASMQRALESLQRRNAP